MNSEKTTNERQGVMRPLVDCVRQQPVLCLCLSCYWFWQLFYFQSPADFSTGQEGLLVDGRLVLLASSGIAYAAIWKGYRRLAPFAARPWWPWLVGVVMVGGTLLQGVAIALPGSTPRLGLLLAANVGMGVGAALFIVELSRIFAQLGPRYALLAGVAGLAGCTLLFLLAMLMPAVGQAALLVTAAAAALASWHFTVRQFPRTRFYQWGLETSLRVPLKLTLTCFAQGVALGVMTGFVALRTAEGSHPVLYVAAFAVGALVVLGTAGTLRLDFNHLLYQVGFPLMGLGFLIQVCLPASADAASFMFTVAHCYVYIIMTCICSYFSNCLKCSPAWIVSLITLAMVGGQVLGAVGVDAGVMALGPQVEGLATAVAGAFAFLLPTSALLLLSSDNTVSGWGAMRPAERRGAIGDDALFAKITSDYKLTGREREILELLSRGRNKRYISEQLGVSEETVKTHMGNLYRKLAVHSQQEVIDLVEAERAARDR